MEKNERTKLITGIAVFIVSLAISIGLFCLDYFVLGWEISFVLIYIIPIAAVTWYSGGVLGLVLSVICIIQWYIVKSSKQVIIYDWLLLLNLLIKLGVYFAIVVFLTNLHEKYERRKVKRKL